MAFSTDIFKLDADKRSDIGLKITKIGKTDSDILYIFWLSEEKMHRPCLTADEIVAAYYNIFTERMGRPKKNKKAIVMRLFLLKGGKENDGLIKTDGKGIYMVRKSTELETDLQRELFRCYQEKCNQWEREYKD